MFRHILPNVLGEVVVLASLWIASAIRIEASLSFIGLGVSPPTPTWGNMIKDGTVQLMNAPWVSIFPALPSLSPCSPSICWVTASAMCWTRGCATSGIALTRP